MLTQYIMQKVAIKRNRIAQPLLHSVTGQLAQGRGAEYA